MQISLFGGMQPTTHFQRWPSPFAIYQSSLDIVVSVLLLFVVQSHPWSTHFSVSPLHGLEEPFSLLEVDLSRRGRLVTVTALLELMPGVLLLRVEQHVARR